ncbi:MAG: hypothetical protein IKF97_05200 [Clostridia bacterium]|nr:hypothetical protein [Clostridia bacterium]
MKSINDFNKTKQLMDEFKKMNDSLVEIDKKMKDRVKEYKSEAKKTKMRIDKLEDQKNMTFDDAKYDINLKDIEQQIDEKIKTEKEQLKLEKNEAAKANESFKNEKARIEENIKLFRADSNIKTITMEIKEIEKEIENEKLEIKQLDVVYESQLAGKLNNEFEWKEIYLRRDELSANIKALTNRIEEYTSFKNELLSMELTQEDYNRIYEYENKKAIEVENLSKEDKSSEDEKVENAIPNTLTDNSISPELKKSIEDIMNGKRNVSEDEKVDTSIKSITSTQDFRKPSLLYSYTDDIDKKGNGPQSYLTASFKNKLNILKDEGINDVENDNKVLYLTKDALKKVDPFLIDYLSYRKDEKTRVRIVKALNEGKDLSEFKDFISYDMKDANKFGFRAKLVYRKIALRAIENGLYVENADKAMMWFDKLLGKSQKRFENKESQKALPEGDKKKEESTLRESIKVDSKTISNPVKIVEKTETEIEKDGIEPGDK